jgi:hypothetical protein
MFAIGFCELLEACLCQSFAAAAAAAAAIRLQLHAWRAAYLSLLLLLRLLLRRRRLLLPLLAQRPAVPTSCWHSRSSCSRRAKWVDKGTG